MEKKRIKDFLTATSVPGMHSATQRGVGSQKTNKLKGIFLI